MTSPEQIRLVNEQLISITDDFYKYLEQMDKTESERLEDMAQQLKKLTVSFQNDAAALTPERIKQYQNQCMKTVQIYSTLLLHNQLNRPLTTIEQITEVLRAMFFVIDLLITSVLCLRHSMDDSYTPGAPSLTGRNHFFSAPDTRSELAQAIDNYQEQLRSSGSALNSL